MPSDRTVRRISLAGLGLALIFLVVNSYTNTEQVKDLIDQSNVSEQLAQQRDLLESQDALIEDALDQIGDLRVQLQTAALQSEALMNQLKSLDVVPIVPPDVIVRPIVVAPTTTTTAVPPTTTTTDKAPGQNKK